MDPFLFESDVYGHFVVNHPFMHYIVKNYQKSRRILPNRLSSAAAFQVQGSYEYYYHMRKAHGIEPYLAKQLLGLFWTFLSKEVEYIPTFLLKYVPIAHELVTQGMILPYPITSVPIYLFGSPHVDASIQGSIEFLPNTKPKETPYFITDTIDPDDQIVKTLEEISRQIDQGIDVNQIKIVHVKEADVHRLKQMAPLFGFGVEQTTKVPLLRLPIGIKLKRRLKKTYGWESVHQVVGELNEIHPHKAMISSFAHEYLREEAFDYPELIDFFLSEKQVEPITHTNVVKICDLNDVWFEDHVYLHLHNAADGLFPMFLQDNTFLTDQEKTQLGLLTSIQENQRMKRTIAFQLEQVHHLTVYTISQRDGKQLSPLDFTWNRSSCKTKREEQFFVFHSQKEAMLRFSKATYHQQTYGQVSKDYLTLRRYFKDMVHPYDPQFKPISKNLNQRLLGKNVTLSATSIELFYHCRFHYLLSSLLKLDDHVPSQALDLGNFTHQVLYEAFSKKSLPPEKKTNFSSLLSRGDGYLLWFKTNIEQRLNEVINELVSFEEHSQFTSTLFEQPYQISLGKNHQFTCKGTVDKIMMSRYLDQDFAVIIDYKTGETGFQYADFQKGIDIQLVLYGYFVNQSSKENQMKIAGFFHQPIPFSKLSKEKTNEPLKKALKLNGILLKDEGVAKHFDQSNSIAGVRYSSKTGMFIRPTENRFFDNEKLQLMFQTLESLLHKCVTLIEQGDYAINPLPIEKSQRISASCEYCPYQSICFLANKTSSQEDVVEETIESEEEINE